MRGVGDGLRNIAPRKGTETFLRLKRFNIYPELRNIAPRKGTETLQIRPCLDDFSLRNIAPRKGTETL